MTKGRYFGTVILLLVIVVFCVSVDAKISVRTSKSLNAIKRKLGSKANSDVNKIQKYAESNEDEKDYSKITGVIDSVGSSLSGLTSGDAFQIVSGALNIMSGLSSLIPVAGPIISSVFSLLSMVFGSLGGGEGIGSVVSKEFGKFDEYEMKSKADGVARVYRASQAYLKNKEGSNLMQHELAALSANVPVYSGVQFLGTLQNKIRENAKGKDKGNVQRAIKYTNLYAVLATLRSSVLWQLYSLVRSTNHSLFTANGIRSVAKAEEVNDKIFLEFVVHPEYSRAVFHAMFYPSKWPIITKVLTFHGNQTQRLTMNGQKSFTPEKWKHYVMVMGGDAAASIVGRRRSGAGRDSLFNLGAVSAEDNIFYIKSVQYPGWYVIMGNVAQGHCRGWKGVPGNNGKWKIVKYPDGKYLLSTLEWPDWFMYMESSAFGYVRGWTGDPGIQGHWIIA